MTLRASLTVKAPAKINASLDVLGRRADGYHSLRSVMQSVSLYDELTLAFSDERNDAELPDARRPSDDYFLVDRAIAELLAWKGLDARITYTLNKRIPMAAGLGGGSSDAAAALRGVNSLLNLGLPPADLAQVGARIGSDVPYFAYGGTALVEGRGECVTSLTAPACKYVILVNDGVPVPTASVFAALNPHDLCDGTSTDEVLAAVAAGELIVGRNDLAPSVFRLFPQVQSIYRQVEALAPGRTGLSGSGGTVFALFDSRDEARAALAALSPTPAWTYLCHTIDAPE